jgi:heavy metal sensor kinase
MWFDLEDTLLTGRSRTLERRADRLSDLLRLTRQDSPKERAAKFQAFADATGGDLMQVLQTNGTRAFPSPSPAAQAFPWPTITTARELFRKVIFSDQPYVVLERPFSSGSESLILCVATSLEGNRPILRTFSVGLLWTIPALLALSALGGYVISRRALKPVDEITAATRSISVSNLSQRLPVSETRDELQRLSETCNAMLARLESAVNEIKRFTADASHELRSPLSFVQTVAELALRNRQADPTSRRALEEIVEECGKAGRLLEDMLTLARADAGNAHLTFEPVDLAEVVPAVCDKARMLSDASQHTLLVSLDGARSAPIRGDYSSLRRLMWILLDNAVKYTPVPGRIHVTLSAEAEKVTVSVEDNGIGISATDLPHIFDRFYRADPSRGHVEGSGLGLAIAKWIAEVHHAGISVESKENSGSVFRVVFPALVENQVSPVSQAPQMADATRWADSAVDCTTGRAQLGG